MPVNRSEWQDDDGSGLYGTPVNNSELQIIYDNVDGEVTSPNFPDVKVRTMIDNLIAGVPFDFGGDPNAWTDRATYATGAGYDPDTIIAPGTRVWKVDPALLIGTFKLEGILRTHDVAKAAKLGLFNMTDAPNVALVEISSNSLTGALVRSADIVFPAGGAEKEFAVKLMTEAPQTTEANGWGYRVFRSE